MHVYEPQKCNESVGSFGARTKGSCELTWTLTTKLGSFGKTLSFLDHQVISPAQEMWSKLPRVKAFLLFIGMDVHAVIRVCQSEDSVQELYLVFSFHHAS